MTALLLLLLCGCAFASNDCNSLEECSLKETDQEDSLNLAQLRASRHVNGADGTAGAATSVSAQKRLTLAAQTTNAMPCDRISDPVQVLKNQAGTAFDVKRLDVFTGSYSKMFSIPMTFSSPPFKRLNSCGISPISNILYCTVVVRQRAFLARIDSDHMEFIASLPSNGEGNSGAFNDNGVFYWGGGLEEVIYAMDEQMVDDLPGYASIDDENIHDLGHKVERTFVNVADIVAVHKDLRNNGDDEEWIIGIGKNGGPDYKVAVVEAQTPNEVFWLDAEGFTLDPKSGGFGAAWAYDGRVFFANNGGQGVYELDMTSIDLEANTCTVTLVGLSETSFSNDGVNCPAPAPAHWKQIAMCKIYGDPHIIGFDNMTAHGIDAEGYVWLLKSDQLYVQGKFEFVSDEVVNGTFMTRVAIGGPALGGNKLTFGKQQTPSYWNNEEILPRKPSTFENDYVTARFRQGSSRIQFPREESAAIEVILPLEVTAKVIRRPYGVDIELAMSTLEGGQDGECGNFNNDETDDTQELIRQRGALQVPTEDLLF